MTVLYCEAKHVRLQAVIIFLWDNKASESRKHTQKSPTMRKRNASLHALNLLTANNIIIVTYAYVVR